VPFSGAHGWNAWMRPTVVVAAVGGAVLLTRGRGFKRLHAVGGALLVASCLFLPAVWSAKTAMTPHEGADPLAGPTVGTVVLHLPTVSKEMRTRTAAGVPPASMGGLLGISRPSAAMVTALTTDAANYTWVAATVGGNNAAGLELATRKPVLALGGFNATDPAPTVAEFRRLVADHAVHYFVADDVHVGVGVSDIATRQIPDWVAAHFVVQHFDAVEVYDLTAPLPEG